MDTLKIKLTKKAFEILTGELEFNQMGALYLMGLGKSIPDNITKLDLLIIIGVLCRHLDWIEEQDDGLKNCQEEKRKPQEIAYSHKKDSEGEEDLDTDDREIITRPTR